MTGAVALAKKVLEIREKLKQAKNSSVLLAINTWAKDNELPPFFRSEDGFVFNKEYQIHTISFEFSWAKFPGYPVFFLKHLPTSKEACFGIADGIGQPRPRK